jgi:hypothetical protein
MINQRTTLAILTLILAFVGCAKPPVMVDRVLVQNATTSKITDVKVLHEPTNRMGKVNAILPQSALDIGLPRQPMLARQAVVSWRDSMGRERQVKLELPYDRSLAKEHRAVSLMYIIHASGRVTVDLQ